MKKLLSVFLTGAMAFTMVPFASIGVSAAETKPVDGVYHIKEDSGYNDIRKNVTSIELVSDTKADFIYSGDTYSFDMSELEFNVKFSDGNSAVFTGMYNTLLVSTDLDETYTIIYKCEVNTNKSEAVFTMRGKNQPKGVSVTVPVNLLEVESISVVSQPDNKEYVADQYVEIEPYGLEVQLNFTNGTNKVVDVSEYSAITNSLCVMYDFETYGINYAYFKLAKGNNEITVLYGDCTTTFNLTGKGVDSIEILKLPELTDFIAGDTVDEMMLLYGMDVLVNFEDGTSIKLVGREEDTDDPDLGTYNCEILELNEDYGYEVAEGKNTVTVAYGGKTDTYEITGHVLESIEIAKLPEKINAPIESFVALSEYVDNMDIKANFTDGSSCVYSVEDTMTEFFASIVFSGENIVEDYWLFVQPGENKITFDFNGYKADFVITGREVEKFEVTKMSEDSEYIAGVTYDGLSMFWDFEFKVTYDDGTSEITSVFENPDLIIEIVPYGKCVEFDEMYIEECLYTAYFTFKEGKNVVTFDYYGATTDVEFIAVAEGGNYSYDVNRDGSTDVRDVTSLQMYLAGYDVEVIREYLDINRDGKVDVTDVTTLQMHLAGYTI